MSIRNLLTILAIYTSCIASSQTSYLPIDKSQNIGLDTLESGKVVIWFDVYGARDIKRKHDQLVSIKESNNLLREQKFILQNLLDSCEKQRANTQIIRDTIINTIQVVDDRYKGALIEKELQRKRAIHFEEKSKKKNWVIFGLVILAALGFGT